MSFIVVQTRKTKRSKPQLAIVPTGWIINKTLFWPPNNLNEQIEDPNSKADPNTWKPVECKIFGNPTTFASAEDTINKSTNLTDSDDAKLMGRQTRRTKAPKKPKFQSKFYEIQEAKPMVSKQIISMVRHSRQ